MTMPHLMNCQHSEDAWCLSCVKELWNEMEEWKSSAERLAKLVIAFSNTRSGFHLAERLASEICDDLKPKVSH